MSFEKSAGIKCYNRNPPDTSPTLAPLQQHLFSISLQKNRLEVLLNEPSSVQLKCIVKQNYDLCQCSPWVIIVAKWNLWPLIRKDILKFLGILWSDPINSDTTFIIIVREEEEEEEEVWCVPEWKRVVAKTSVYEIFFFFSSSLKNDCMLGCYNPETEIISIRFL